MHDAFLETGLSLFVSYDTLDPVSGQGARLGPALAIVVEEHGDRRGIDAAQHRALGVMIVIGRLVARGAPHDIGRAPAELAGADDVPRQREDRDRRSEEHTSELQSLMRISYAVFCLQKNKNKSKNKI